MTLETCEAANSDQHKVLFGGWYYSHDDETRKNQASAIWPLSPASRSVSKGEKCEVYPEKGRVYPKCFRFRSILGVPQCPDVSLGINKVPLASLRSSRRLPQEMSRRNPLTRDTSGRVARPIVFPRKRLLSNPHY